MYTLFIDSHGELITVSLSNEKEIIKKEQESEYSHAKYLVPMIDAVLKENNLRVENIEKIVAVNGPGSFTGLRIGLSVAKTMAYSLNIPIYLISSLEAYLVSSNIEDNKLAVIEDNKGYYICAFDKENNTLIEECYVTSIDKYNDYKIVNKELDIKKVIDYATKKESINPHLVRANYVKEIEVLK